MAQVIRTSQFPNLLVLQGTDVAARNSGNQWYHLLRNGVKNALFSDTNGIGNFRGQTDFIICYVVSGAGLDFSGVDHTPANEMPPLRPLRGIIQLSPNLRTPVTNNMLVGHLSGAIGHEIGHYWLIPGRARVRIGNQEIDTPTANEIAMSLNNGLGMPKVPMIGRQDTHWSPFIHTEGSFMDGIDHAFDPFNPILERLYGFSKSTGISGSGVTFDFEGQTITTAHKFNDFELFLMGLSPTMGTPANRKLQILESSWVYPLPFHAGLYVELQNGETWYHGFHTGPNQIRALPTSSLSQEPITWLESPFDPINRVVFRLVQQGSEIELQARVFKPQRIGPEGCLYAILTGLGAKLFKRPTAPGNLDCKDVLSDSGFVQAANNNVYQGWRRLARISGTAARIGLAARHIGSPCFARIRPKIMCLAQNGQQMPIDQNMSTENEIGFADSTWGSTVGSDGSLVLPYRFGPNSGGALLHDNGTNSAPRRVMNAPSGDFVFGAEIELSECIIVSWAGGAGKNRTYVGNRREVAYSDVNYLANWGTEYESIRQAEPEGGSYRFLFCLVSNRQLTDVDRDGQLAELDRIRRAWEPAFDPMTSGRRGADTTIPFL